MMNDTFFVHKTDNINLELVECMQLKIDVNTIIDGEDVMYYTDTYNDLYSMSYDNFNTVKLIDKNVIKSFYSNSKFFILKCHYETIFHKYIIY